jgi:hypothetical protein
LRRHVLFGSAAAAVVLSSITAAQTVTPDFSGGRPHVYEMPGGEVVHVDETGTYAFASWQEYWGGDLFKNSGMRCNAISPTGPLAESTADCSNSLTNPANQYAPSGGLYRIPVVFHVLKRKNNTGNVTNQQIFDQITVLNEDFKALAGTPGGPGTNTQIEFFLATEDPNGNPTSGITHHKNNTWFQDGGTYYNSVGWDTNRYLNIYTNTAGGSLGYAYVPSGGGVVGQTWDGVRLHYATIGRPAPYGPPYNQGRTATHEVGHYLGLYHTFDGGCASTSGCYSNGDLICDTNPEQAPNYSPCSRSTCGSSDPTDNYMDYSDDLCMDNFTSDQTRRMRCTIENFRFNLPDLPSLPGQASNPSPADGASNASTSSSLSWSAGSGADSHDVYFGTNPSPGGGEFQGNQGSTSLDPGTLAASTTYYWRVDEVNGLGTTTGDVWSFTTAAPGGAISLSANGYKVKGKWRADLSWSGAAGSQVDIYREGSFLTTTANDGVYTDVTTFKGGGSLTYQVCETGGGACSNSATANF